jgi:aminopeptidase N
VAAAQIWSVAIADPGVDAMFDSAIYARGAATLHALRLRIGDARFFRLLRRWAQVHAGGTVTTAQLVDLAEQGSGEDLRAFFDEWLFSDTRPRDR